MHDEHMSAFDKGIRVLVPALYRAFVGALIWKDLSMINERRGGFPSPLIFD